MKRCDPLGGSRATGFTRSLQLLFLFLGAGGLAAAPAGVGVANLPPAANRGVEFVKDIRPLFEKSCLSCHGAEKQKGGYRLDSKASAFKGGETYTPAIQPGNSAGSPLIHLVAGLVPDSKMPAKGDPLTPEQVGLLRAWIDQGAAWPDEGREVDPIKSHWAFQPVRRPSLPWMARSSKMPTPLRRAWPPIRPWPKPRPPSIPRWNSKNPKPRKLSRWSTFKPRDND